MAKDIILQDLPQVVVQVLADDGDACVGTGVIISLEGKIVTCLHVLGRRAVDDPGTARFRVVLPPELHGGSIIDTTVVASSPDVDLATLAPSEPIRVPPSHVAIIGGTGRVAQRRFHCYGFRALGDQLGGFASGRILGHVQSRYGAIAGGFSPVQLESSQITSGMSGAPILDKDRNLVVAVASETWFTDATLKDRDTAWATDLANLVAVLGEPAELLVDEASKGGMGARVIDAELRGLLPKLDAAMRDSPGPELTFAAPPLMLLRGRRSILLDLTEAFDDEEITVTSLVGLGGEGKSSILRTWIDGHVAATSEPVTVFWWAFDGNASIDDFFRSLLSHFVDHASLPKELVEAVQSKGSRAEIAVHLLTRSPVILVLDGLEAVVGRGTLGRLPDDLRTLVRAVAANDVGSHCFVGSRVPIADLADLEPHDIVKVLPLRDRDALDLLADQGVQGPADARERIVRSMGNHALSVVVAGGLIAARYEGDAARFTGLEELDEVDGATEAGARFERLFSEYDQILSDAERAVLTLLAAQRRPMPQVAFDKIAQGAGSSGSVLHPLASLSRTQYLATVARLSSLGLVATDGENQTYSCHPIVRDHFMRALEDAGVARQRAFYRAVGAGYLKCVSSTTLSAVGLGVAGIAAGVLVRAGGAIGASMRVAADGVRADPNVMDGVYFMYRYANPTKPEVEADADTT